VVKFAGGSRPLLVKNYVVDCDVVLASFEQFWIVNFQANFDIEVDAYKHHLERVYRLCHTCDMLVRQELTRQDALIRSKMHTAGLLRSQSTINADVSRLSATDLPVCLHFLC